MSNTFKVFAVVGAGGAIGKPVLKSLLSSSATKVVVLTRPDSSSMFEPNPKLAVEKVKADDENAVAAVLQKHGVEVLISTIGFTGFESQVVLADAAKHAGVQLFVPSDFCGPTEGLTEGLLIVKEKVVGHAKEIGLPTLRVYNGLFTEHSHVVGAVEDTGKFLVPNPGDKPFSLTSLSDIGAFLAYTFTTLAPSQLLNTAFRIEGERLTFSELGAIYGELKSVPVEHVSKVPEGLPRGFILEYFWKDLNSGQCVSSYDLVQDKDLGTSALSNNLWAEYKWRSVRDVLSK
ncbi:NAD(P)-binding protein [Coniophora puteana RWD-64-598 SS2]|uniref:NAD(P)-binding protein n=1 Tax=Coniophora puteana (strain RWD-64-598) TaxID=741705 RepID=A0A5M3MHN9_CONPW|nr:NAD(P)-binding protein [Coniophora puteana RWD-64-598 SS2]EIW78155.1 NAD(P)-binding protein [Coniophora puteana RWD-64-598 SS2]